MGSPSVFLFFALFLPPYFAIADEPFSACEPFTCGNITDLSYPFWFDSRPEYCGHPKFKLNCQGDNATINMASQDFRVIDVNSTTRTLTIARMDLWGTKCPNEFNNFTLDYAVFNYTSNDVNSTMLYNCDPLVYTPPPVNLSTSLEFDCPAKGYPIEAYFLLISEKWFNWSALGCRVSIIVPVLGVAVKSFMEEAIDPGDVIDQGFEVEWEPTEGGLCNNCKISGGRCGYNISLEEFTCFCPNKSNYGVCVSDLLSGTPTQAPLLQPEPYPQEPAAPPQKKFSLKNKVIVGAVTAAFVAIVMLTGFFFYQRRKKTSYAKSYMQSHATSSVSSMTVDPEINASKYFGVPVFTYTELEEATNNFDEARELGDGGFGTVYFGKLRDGRCVAVKRLYENNYKRVEQFINEVQILTRLRHTNLVSLYGCTSRHSRELLLVYEYIPNGTVADHLHGDRAKPGSLPWNIRMNIAIETASALAYLHASDIIHRDVKTNNILLDNHFVVKVADFGLSRLFPDHVTHVSTAPQGTPGYVDPEYHECYKLTDKSDVYSFGVVLIELISSLPAVDITRHRHEINLSTMAINKIQNRALHELVDPTLGFESDQKVRKMINAVAELAFQCLQNLKDMRPSMEEVLETLRDIESDGKHKSKPEVMDISDDVGLLKNDLPPPSSDSNLASKSTTSNSSS